MDGDGNIDIIAATATGVIVYSGKGNGFEFTVSYTGSKYVAVGGMDIGDLDGDYLPEIVLSHCRKIVLVS
ncbi:MAG: VCBS repeat-containing protein [Bacteroidetes bacterium]|nr:VCBS repeat-containing protein [Bacteroidota bacterium]